MAKSKRGLATALKLTPEVKQFVEGNQSETSKARKQAQAITKPQDSPSPATHRCQKVPEVKQFVEGNQSETSKARKQAQAITKPQDSPSPATHRCQKVEAGKVGKVGKEFGLPNEQPTRKRTDKRSQKEAANIALLRVPFSTRIDSQLIQQLMRISVERKLAGKQPWSQQAITEAALQEWLAKHA